MMETAKKLGVKYVVAVPLVAEQKILKQDIKKNCVEVLTELSDPNIVFVGIKRKEMNLPSFDLNNLFKK